MSNLKDARANILPDLGQKWQKTDNIQQFHFSQSESHIIDHNIISVFLN